MAKTVVAIVGAGIAGLCSAHVLARLGHQVIVIDKGKSFGGRLATRVLSAGSRHVYVDTAAIHFVIDRTAPKFAALWKDLYGSSSSESPRTTTGINSVANTMAKHLKADSVSLKLNTTVNDIKYNYDQKLFSLRTAAQEELLVHAVLLTPPLPQAATLIATCPPSRMALPKSVEYYQSILLLLVPKSSSTFSSLRSSGSIYSIVEQNHIRANSHPYPIVVHATYSWSRENYHLSDEEIKKRLLMDIDALDSEFDLSVIKRWGLARPRSGLSSVNGYLLDTILPLAVCSDALGAGTISSSAEAGMECAEQLSARLCALSSIANFGNL